VPIFSASGKPAPDMALCFVDIKNMFDFHIKQFQKLGAAFAFVRIIIDLIKSKTYLLDGFCL
jgi:hypothetical protein